MSYREWADAYGRASLRNDEFNTLSHIPVEAAYGTNESEWPGKWPYTRGPYESPRL